jgi:outer membrane murein-binding lipoprotein Lpp
MMQNNLFLNRLLIYTDEDKVAYDETFHKGVNIIRGDNSSGKSTITHFMFFVMGGAFHDWVPEAKKCSVVFAEVEMNGAVFTMKREIVKDLDEKVNDKIAIYFYWGALDEGLITPIENGWFKYEYNTTENKKSFSNVIFENLDLPIVKGDNNITFHQILRLLYIDQDSPTNSLFLYEYFDTNITRETVSDLLLGVYNQELYDKKKRNVVVEKDLDAVKKEIKVTETFFSDPLSLNPTHLLTSIENKQNQIYEIEEDIIAIKNKNKEVLYDKKTKLEFQILNEESISQRKKVNKLEEEIKFLNYEIEDSELFVDTLRNKIKALKNSIATRDFLGSFPLDYCPECLTVLNATTVESSCKLCKENIDESFGVIQARKMEQEISFQIIESTQLLELNKKKIDNLSSSYSSENIKLRQLQTQVNSALNDVKPIREEAIDKLYMDKGFVEGEIIQLRTLLENAELYQKLADRKNELEKEYKYLRGYIYNTEQEQLQLKEAVNSKIEKQALFLLNNDLERQEDFKEAKEFHIDYRNNIAFIADKNARYSASSNFYLKTAARFAIFLASLSIEKMRYPRFIFSDNMEDKGIEPKRAQNFQRILIDKVEEYDSNSYQMIYTTSYISDELNNTAYCIGEYYTKANPSLKNIRRN